MLYIGHLIGVYARDRNLTNCCYRLLTMHVPHWYNFIMVTYIIYDYKIEYIFAGVQCIHRHGSIVSSVFVTVYINLQVVSSSVQPS